MPRRTKEQVVTFDLKAAREAVGLSQIEAAKLLKHTQSTISRWEIDGCCHELARDYWLLYWKHNKPAKKKKQAPQSEVAAQ